MKKKFAVVLSGCGFLDGAEITEAVSTLIGLSQHDVEYHVFAPNKNFTATNHLNQQAAESRNVMAESARISRGKIQELHELKAKNFDAVVFPGGFGAARWLSNWAEKGAQCDVEPEVKRVIKEFANESKPIGAFCIAPTLVAKVLGAQRVTLTIGDDEATAKEIEKTGAHHEPCKVDDFVTDRESKVVTTPAYMYGDAKPHDVFTGISKAIRELVEMA